MEQNKRFEVFGTLTKTETIFTIDQKILQGTLVFEALKPFPDYFNDAAMTAKPMYLYLALEEQYPLEDIIRASQKIQLDFNVSFDAGKDSCVFTMRNTMYCASDIWRIIIYLRNCNDRSPEMELNF